MMHEKIRPHHLERKAILYVRQSSAYQVLHNRESGTLQYAMRDRLTALGWSRIDTIDDDLGRSAAGGVARAGFDRMVAEVCLGKVGTVAAREVSRFARNSRDWQQLIEMCHRRSVEPDWAHVHRELKRKHVTLQILWDEYIERHPDGYRYSRFCDLYRGWAANLPVTMRQNHGAGEKLFVDYAGDTVTVVVDRLTGKTRQAHLFVAVLGASSLSYAEARWSETLADWLGCHVNALEAIGGAPALLVPDNAKVAVIKACRYDPQVNRSYAGMADHYGSSVLPTRPRRPRDKIP